MSDFYNKYPYTDFHELNLDWVIERVKKLTEDWLATQAEWNDTEEQWQQLHDYVMNYFDNLDVSQEINDKIDAMVSDGTFLNIIRSTVEAQTTTATENWLAAHIIQPTTPVVDNTLTIAGAAADSKTVGDKFKTVADYRGIIDARGNSKTLSDYTDPGWYNVFCNSTSEITDYPSNSDDLGRSTLVNIVPASGSTLGTQIIQFIISSTTKYVYARLLNTSSTPYASFVLISGASFETIVNDISNAHTGFLSLTDRLNAMPNYRGSIDARGNSKTLSDYTDPGWYNVFCNTASEITDYPSNFDDMGRSTLVNIVPASGSTLGTQIIQFIISSTTKYVYARLLNTSSTPYASFVLISGASFETIVNDISNAHTGFLSLTDRLDAMLNYRTAIDARIVTKTLTDYIKPGWYNILNQNYLITDYPVSSGTDFEVANLFNLVPISGSSLGTYIMQFLISVDGHMAYSRLISNSGSIISDWRKIIDYKAFENDYQLICWGDSLTAGAGGNGTNYPEVIKSELGLSRILNAGVGGENVETIAARQGGNALIIPAGSVNGTYAAADMKDMRGGAVLPLKQGISAQVNPIRINNINCTLAYDSGTDTYTISGYTGSATAFETCCRMARSNLTADITIIFAGQNGQATQTIEERMSYIDSMLTKVTNGKYIVLTLSTGSASSRQTEEEAMLAHYGIHCFMTRHMLSQYGMDLMGLTPTATDASQIAAGTVPDSLRSDSTHLNEYGYTALGKMLAERIRSLGYI